MVKRLNNNYFLARRYDIEDPEIHEFSRVISGELEIMEGPITALDFFPWLVPVMPNFIKNSWMQANVLEESRDRLNQFIMVCYNKYTCSQKCIYKNILIKLESLLIILKFV